MKKIAFYILFSCIALNFSNCAGGKDVLFEREPPFEVKGAFFQNWVAGIKGGGSGTNVSILLGSIIEEIAVKEIYYMDQVTKAVQDPQNIDKYTGFFKSEINRDVIMDENAVKESMNTPPSKSPFTLSKNEAVISYLHNGEIEYYKISNLEEKPMIAYPGSSPNGDN
jgi:hypothetical protein